MESYAKLLLNGLHEHQPALPELDLLARVRIGGVLKGEAELRAPWGIDLPQSERTVVLYFVRAGSCYVQSTEGGSQVLTEGDALLVPRPVSIAMSDQLTSPRSSLYEMINGVVDDVESADEQLKMFFQASVPYGGTGVLTHITTLRLFIDKNFPASLLSGLPTMIVSRGYAVRNGEFLASILDQISSKGSLGYLGQAIAIRLSEGVLVDFLQDHLHALSTRRPGVHSALGDSAINKAVGAVQKNPGHEWSVVSLASIAGLSRSVFMDRFTKVVGETPNHYVLGTRMTLAADLLLNTSLSLALICGQIGYNSESSFVRAFHKWAGTTPGRYRSCARRGVGG